MEKRTGLESIKVFVNEWLKNNIAFSVKDKEKYLKDFYFSEKALFLNEISPYGKNDVEEVINLVKRTILELESTAICFAGSKLYNFTMHNIDSKDGKLLINNTSLKEDLNELMNMYNRICKIEFIYYPKYISSLNQKDIMDESAIN